MNVKKGQYGSQNFISNCHNYTPLVAILEDPKKQEREQNAV